MSYPEAAAYLESLGIDSMKSKRPSTERIEILCELLDHPERSVPAIHVTGTNGKTSVARLASSILSATGLKVGTFTSPHLEDVRERIASSGAAISEHDFGETFDHLLPYLELVRDKIGQAPTYFEVLAAMFFVWAADNVDASVVEVGLGGRWDATNVVPAPVSVICNIALDHTKLLGQTKETIAREKAGIIKPGGMAVTAERVPEIQAVIAQEAAANDAFLSVLGRDFSVTENRLAFGGRYMSVVAGPQTYEGLFVPLHGSHQGVNAATAIEAVRRFLSARDVDPEVVAEGLAATVVPGRLEGIRPDGSDATVVLDVAHNPDGMSALVTSLAEAFAFDEVKVVLGVLADKDFEGMLAELSRLPCSLLLAEPKNARAIPAGRMAEAASELGISTEIVGDVPKAVDVAIEQSSGSNLVCVTGSHYVVGEARTHLLATPSRFPRKNER